MGYGIIPKVGEPYCCEKPCTHTDCKAMREDFIEHANCKVCNKPLTEGDSFYYHGECKYDKVHSLCI
jgi:hypothetical protein